MKNNNINKIIIIIVILTIFFLILGYKFKTELFGNENGNIDKNIVWSAVSSLLNVAVIIVAIITIYIESNNRKKQNEYEKIKEKEIRDQENFEKECKKIFDKLVAQDLFEKIIAVDNKNYKDVLDKISAFRGNLNLVEINLNWYYPEEYRQLDIPYCIYLREVINSYRTNNDRFLEKIYNEIRTFYNAEIFLNLEQMEKLEKTYEYNSIKIVEENNEDLKKYRREYKDYSNMVKIIKENIGKIILDYNPIRNTNIIKLQEAFLNAIKERESKVRENLAKMDKEL